MQEFIRVLLPSLYGIPWNYDPYPWINVPRCFQIFERCFTLLYYSNLFTDFSAALKFLKKLMDNYATGVLTKSGRDAITLHTNYDHNSVDFSDPQKVGFANLLPFEHFAFWWWLCVKFFGMFTF